MPDFDVNEGYAEAARRRADASLPGLPADGVSVDGRVDPYGLDVTSDYLLGDVTDAFLSQGGQSGGERSSFAARKLPEETPIVRRTRHLAVGHFSAGGASPGRRVGVRLIARRRRLARRACPFGWQVRVLGTPPRRRRRLWTKCH
jgi:hypothetical protein